MILRKHCFYATVHSEYFTYNNEMWIRRWKFRGEEEILPKIQLFDSQNLLIRKKYLDAFLFDDQNSLNPNTFLNLRKRIWFPFLQSTNHVSHLFSSSVAFFSKFTSSLEKMRINIHAFYPAKNFTFMINYWKLRKN